MPTALKDKLFQARLTQMDMDKLQQLAASQQLHPAEWFRVMLRQEYDKLKK